VFRYKMVLTESKEKLQLGDEAPEFSLPGIDDKTHRLSEISDANAVLIIFMCNHCPYVQAKFKTIKDLQEKFKSAGLVVIGINSNDVEKYPEDNFEKMKEYAQQYGFNFIYLLDQTQEIAKAYGAQCTPDPFLFDKEKKLVYHGRFDDAHGPDKTPTTHEMQDAIQSVVVGGFVKSDQKPSMGCSIKWK